MSGALKGATRHCGSLLGVESAVFVEQANSSHSESSGNGSVFGSMRIHARHDGVHPDACRARRAGGVTFEAVVGVS